MLILLMIVLQSQAYQINLCNALSIFGASCNQKCIKKAAPNNDSLSLKYSCLNSHSNFIECLIHSGISIEASLPLISHCFSTADLEKLKGFAKILQKQSYCLNYFTLNFLIEDWNLLEKNNEYLGYSIKEISTNNCKIKTYKFGELLAENIAGRIVLSDTRDLIQILLDEFCEKDENLIEKFKEEEMQDNEKEEFEEKPKEKINEKFKEKSKKPKEKNKEKPKEEIIEKSKGKNERKDDKSNSKNEENEKDYDDSSTNENYDGFKKIDIPLIEEDINQDKWTSYILDILNNSGNYVYCVINRIDSNIPVSQLKGILPDNIVKALKQYLPLAKKLIGSKMYECSASMNLGIDLAISTLLLSKKEYGKAAAGFTGSINDYYSK